MEGKGMEGIDRIIVGPTVFKKKRKCKSMSNSKSKRKRKSDIEEERERAIDLKNRISD